VRSTNQAAGDFDIDAFYDALDTERQMRGMSWAQLTAEINVPFQYAPSRPFSASTVTGIREKRSVTSAVILALLRWLGRSPESFVPGHVTVDETSERLPDVPDRQVIRVDTKALYMALDQARRYRGMTWNELASELPHTRSPMLTGLAKGPLIGFPQLTRITQWLGVPVARFVRGYDW
jgi:transcriptional regulator with XRE-family HTH domain